MDVSTHARLSIWFSAALFLTVAAAVEPESAPRTDSLQQQQALTFFENRIRPLLIERCYECHAGESHEGGLRLDVADALSRGGDSGPVVVPGDPEGSLLVAAVRYEGLEMPPSEPLPAQQQADLVRWVSQGAYWPITQAAASPKSQQSEPPQSWWAAEPIDPGPPWQPTAGVESPTTIDGYLDRRLQHEGLRRAAPADRATQLRRLSYDLLGLPPTPAATARFLADDSPAAYQRVVDSLFADPAYGERMARLWLDLVRYAESDGWRADAYRPQAWRYRQFVTDAFNEKMPYDRFVAWQLAGDEIAPADDRAVAAVGFLRLGIYEYNQRDAEGQWQNIVDELTDVTADVFLATGLACAKCHDHKFDPIPRADYYRFRSVFEPLMFVDRRAPPKSGGDAEARIQTLLDQLDDVQGESIKEIRAFTVDRFPLDAQAMYHRPPAERNSYEHQIAYLIERQVVDEGLKGDKLKSKIGAERFAKWQEIRRQLQKLDADPFAPARWMTVEDAPAPVRPTRLPGRSSGAVFTPAVPQVFGGEPLQIVPPVDAPNSTGRRSALAGWMTEPDNPITARVIVNRLWQYHFGTGLVASANDFGLLGQPPSHPQLLDYLAARLIDSNWNLQWIQREIVLSAAYRQSSIHPASDRALAIDSDNRLLWHKSVRRLDAEQYRDSLLVAMDRLIDQVGGPSIAGTAGRRSLYLQRFRNQTDEMLASLDAPPGIVGTARRDQTTTAPQSLMMMNSPRLIGAAKHFAARVRREVSGASGDPRPPAGASPGATFVDHAHRILVGRSADPATIALLAPLAASGEAGQVDVCHVLLNSNAFLYVD